MANNNRPRAGRSSTLSGGSNTKSGSKSPAAPASGKGPVGKGKGAGRAVAAARRGNSSNRTQFIIGGVAIVVIIIVVVVGIVLKVNSNHAASAPPDDGYGHSKSSVATIDSNGVITVKTGSPKITLDIWEDAMCPYCGEFEQQFGQQMAKVVDAGEVQINYHMVDFLNDDSPSKDYSDRAYAALISLATAQGSSPGVWMSFHSSLFDTSFQPKEGGSTDHTNAELAAQAGKMGANSAVQATISAGTDVSKATTDAATNYTALTTKLGGSASTPTVFDGDTQLNPLSGDNAWLTKVLQAAGYTTT